MNKIILNPEKIPSIVIKDKISYVAKIKVWKDVEEGYWKVYYLQKQFEKTEEKANPKLTIESYQGSSAGKRKANPEMLKDMQNSSKDIEIEIIEICNTDRAAYFEQLAITEHIFLKNPLSCNIKDSKIKLESGTVVKDCYNQNNGGGLYTLHPKNMLSNIQYMILKQKLKDHKIRGLAVFTEGFLSSADLEYYIENDLFIQSRASREGNESRIALNAEKMKKDPDPNNWNGVVVVLLNEDGTIWKILDGNQSAHACIRVADMKGLRTIEVPYELHRYMIEADLESTGNDLNFVPDDSRDYVSLLDIERNIENIVKAYKLLTRISIDGKGGLPKFDHPVLVERLADLGVGAKELHIAKTSVLNKFKDAKKAAAKKLDGTYNFSTEALAVTTNDQGKEIPNNNLREFENRMKQLQHEFAVRPKNPITFNDSNTHKMMEGMFGGGKLFDKFQSLYFNVNSPYYGKVPENYLVVVVCDLQKQFDEFFDDNGGTNKGRPDKIQFIKDALKSEKWKTNLEIQLLPISKDIDPSYVWIHDAK